MSNLNCMALKSITSDKYKQLSDVDHVLLRSEIYTGSRKPAETVQYFMFPDGKIYPERVNLVPATLVLAHELISNGYDEYRRCINENREHKLDRIDVTINLQEKSILVTDNGGIPVVKHEDTGLILPTLLFGRLRSSSNYTNERGDVAGLNGVGAVLVNIFSDIYRVTTADGEHKFDQIWRNNLSVEEEPVITKSKERFSAFYAKFTENPAAQIDTKWYNVDFARAVEMKCCELAAMGADEKQPLHVYWKTILEDGTVWQNEFCFRSFEDYLEHWPNRENMIYDDQYRFKVAVGLSNGAQESVALVNSIRCDWGTHINTFIDACVFHIRAYINNKYKIDVKPAKVKSYIRMISTWRIDSPVFKGQTKDELVSSPAEFGFPCIPSEQFVRKLLRSSIVAQLVEELHHKINEQRKAELAQQQRNMDRRAKKNLLPEKLTDAGNAGKPGCDLFIVEGDSAAGGFKKFRNAYRQGVFAMFGKSCGNTLYWDEFRILGNKAWNGLMQGLGLSFVKDSKLRYDRIIMAQDADYDGYNIFGLMMVYFNRFFPELFDQHRIFRLLTPIAIAVKGDDIRRYYNYADFQHYAKELNRKKYTVSYNKGLASLNDHEYQELMNNPVLVEVTKDEFADESIAAWFGSDSSKRKELMGVPVNSELDMAEIFGDEDDLQDYGEGN